MTKNNLKVVNNIKDQDKEKKKHSMLQSAK